MDKLAIVYVDDQREVLSTLSSDLEIFSEYVNLEECESAVEALEIIDEIDGEGDMLAIVISDHIMPEMSGVEFLSKVHQDSRFPLTKKILLTGQATHEDTIEAINNAKIQRYITKPWKSEEIHEVVKKQLTHYILEKGIDYMPYMNILDKKTLFELLSKR
ncbi:MAG: hypothetical protein CSA05_02740 [Bacteroidia bacterium]|nr:MAG: hypothetical protein CSA05_02740 [Bacteroidia bacterium]